MPYVDLADQVLQNLVARRCVSITGLSNSGKSTLMRTMATPEFSARYEKQRKHPVEMIYIDCNRAVALSARAFFEVVLRSVLEAEQDHWDGALLERLRGYYQQITEA